jgi:hypothetical protein
LKAAGLFFLKKIKLSVTRPAVIIPKSKSEMKIATDLLRKLQIPSRPLTEEEVEDFGMTILMMNTDRTKLVSKKTIIKKLIT